MKTTDLTLVTLVALKDLPKGTYLQLKAGGPVWVRGDYCRASKAFSLTRFDDINREAFRKGSTLVVTGFEF